MKLLVVVNSLQLGGAERLISEQLRLANGRWEARVVCLDSIGALGPVLQRIGVPVEGLELGHRWDPRAAFRLRRIIVRWRPDIIHLHLPRSAFFGRIASIGLPPKIVYTEHNTWDIYSLPSRCLNALTYCLNDQTIAVSSAVADYVTGAAGALGEKDESWW